MREFIVIGFLASCVIFAIILAAWNKPWTKEEYEEKYQEIRIKVQNGERFPLIEKNTFWFIAFITYIIVGTILITEHIV